MSPFDPIALSLLHVHVTVHVGVRVHVRVCVCVCVYYLSIASISFLALKSVSKISLIFKQVNYAQYFK